MAGENSELQECAAQKEFIEQISEERRFLALTLDNIPDAVFYIDDRLIFRQCNAAGARFLGCPIRRIIRHHIDEVVTADVPIRGPIEEVLRTGKPQDARVVTLSRPHYEKNGGKHYLVSYIPDIRASGRVGGVFASASDVTGLIEAERHERELEAHKREFYRRTILAATGGKLVLTDRDEIIKLLEEGLGEWELREPAQLADIRKAISSLASEEGFVGDRLYCVASCVGEAVTNTVKYAGSGKLSMYRNHDGLFFVVEDKGPGMAALDLPDVALTPGYTTAGTAGLGFKMIIKCADRVYLDTGPDGTMLAFYVAKEEQDPAEEAAELDPCAKYISDPFT